MIFKMIPREFIHYERHENFFKIEVETFIDTEHGQVVTVK